MSSSEFEVIAKCLCIESGITISKNANIIELSSKILLKYPSIVQTEVRTFYQSLLPLSNWQIKNNKVIGLDWWKSYANLKHDRFNNFNEATLKNCLFALSSLLVLELYLQKIVCGDLDNTRRNEIEYFEHKYSYEYLVVDEGACLPDF